MTADRETAPLQRRRVPQQRRARDTVEAILEATRDLVTTRGLEAVTTRMIARRAGVSIGSLYQYFPTYEAILFTWYERTATEAARIVRVTTLEVMDKPIEQSTRIAIGGLLDIYRRDRLVLIEMPDRIAQIRQVIDHTSLEVLNRGTIRLFLSQHPEFDMTQVDRHVFMIETVIYQVMRRYVLHETDVLTAEEIVEELCAIVFGYLDRHRATS